MHTGPHVERATSCGCMEARIACKQSRLIDPVKKCSPLDSLLAQALSLVLPHMFKYRFQRVLTTGKISATFMHVCQCPPRSDSQSTDRPRVTAGQHRSFDVRVSWSRRTHAQDTKAIDVGSDLSGNNESIEEGRLALRCARPGRCFVVSRSRGGRLRLSVDATPRVPIPALFVGVAMTVEHISSEVSTFAFRGKGDSTGGRARDLSPNVNTKSQSICARVCFQLSQLPGLPCRSNTHWIHVRSKWRLHHLCSDLNEDN